MLTKAYLESFVSHMISKLHQIIADKLDSAYENKSTQENFLFMVTNYYNTTEVNRGADKSLARPGRKQVTATEDFDVHISYLLS
jgi:hypothetical protein